MEEIKAWLESPEKDYQTGLQLLRKHSRAVVMVNHLARKESPYNREKLAYELSKLADVPFIAKTAEVAPEAPADPSKDQKPVESIEDLNKRVAEVLEQFGKRPKVGEPGFDLLGEIVLEQAEIFKLKAALSNRLGDDMPQEERAALVVEIDRLKEKYDGLAEKKRLIETTGQLPVEPDKTELTADQKIAALKGTKLNLHSKISRTKKALEGKPEDAELASKLSQFQLELQAADTELKALQLVAKSAKSGE